MSRILETIIDSARNYIKESNVQTTSLRFRCVTKHTVGLISAFVCIILMNILYGGAIECYPSDMKYVNAITLKCWMDGVFLDGELMGRELVPGTQLIKPGVGIHHNYNDIERINFKYYQWIIPMLILQSIIFHLPYLFWQSCEKKTVSKLLGKVSFPVFSDEWEKQRKSLIAYIKDVKQKYHREYALKYLISEIFAVCVVVFNILLTKWVIHHEKANFWNGYGHAVISFLTGDFVQFGYDAALLFPTQSKCDFNIYGPSGSVEKKDALCILPQNVIIDKVFVVLYIWYIVAFLISIFSVAYHVTMFSCNNLRIFDIGFMLERTVTIREVKEISNNGSLGLWFTLKTYRRNLVPIQFQDLCQELHKSLKKDGKVAVSRDQESEDIENYY